MKIGSELGSLECIHGFIQISPSDLVLAPHDLFFVLGSSFYQDKHSDIVSRRLDHNCALWSVFMVLQRFYLVT